MEPSSIKILGADGMVILQIAVGALILVSWLYLRRGRKVEGGLPKLFADLEAHRNALPGMR